MKYFFPFFVYILVSTGVYKEIYAANTIETPFFQKSKILITQLNNADTLVVIYFVSGCTNNKSQKKVIRFEKLRDKITVEYNTFRRILTNDEINTIKIFEKKIDTFTSIYKCTRAKHYLFLINGEMKKNRIDNSCSWDGFEYLINVLRLS